MNRSFVLPLGNITAHAEYCFPNVEIKDYNLTLKNDKKHTKIFKEIATGQVNDYTPVFLPDYPYFKENYEVICIDFLKKAST